MQNSSKGFNHIHQNERLATEVHKEKDSSLRTVYAFLVPRHVLSKLWQNKLSEVFNSYLKLSIKYAHECTKTSCRV